MSDLEEQMAILHTQLGRYMKDRHADKLALFIGTMMYTMLDHDIKWNDDIGVAITDFLRSTTS